jgi:putative cell wall-binding protein
MDVSVGQAERGMGMQRWRRVRRALIATVVGSSVVVGGVIGGAGAASGGAARPVPRVMEAPPEPDCPPIRGTVGLPEAFGIEAVGGTGIDGRIASGAMPPGMTLRDDGDYRYYSGVPTAAGRFSFRLQLEWEHARTGPVSFADCLVEVKPAPTVRRIDAVDRYEESALIARQIAPRTASLVYIASGEGFADALGAAAVAGNRRAPLLLTSSAAVPPAVIDELSRISPADIVVVGGEHTVQPAVVAQLEAMPFAPRVHRIGGADRYDVSQSLVLHPRFGLPQSTSPQIYLANGSTFPDALSAAPSAVMHGVPVLLVDGRQPQLPARTRAAIDALGSTGVKLMGGDASINAALAADLETIYGSIRRFGGATRYDVSRRITLSTFPYTHPRANVYLAAGESYPDALTGGALAGIAREPLYLTPTTCLPRPVAQHIGRLGPDTVTLLGGRASLNDVIADLTVCP